MIDVFHSFIISLKQFFFMYRKVGNNKVIPWMLSATLTVIIPLGNFQKIMSKKGKSTKKNKWESELTIII